MASSLHSLFQAITTAQSEQALRFRFMDGVSEYFGVQRWGIYLLNQENCLASFDVEGVSDAFVERYEKIGKSVDPVLLGGWKRSELYQRCCSEYDHEHIMTGPIVGCGQLIGTVHFARVVNTPAFSQHDLVSVSAVCTHLSVRLAQLRKQYYSTPEPILKRLTPREVQIANLVAKGLTNAEIGAELWITQNSVKQALKRMFRKLEVSARTEMVAKLRDILQ